MSIATIAKTNTVRADFGVCCDHKSNRLECTKTMNALKKNFNNIVEMQATRPYGTAEDMCVIGTAIIKPSMRAQFEKDLRRKVNKTSSIKIKKSVVTLPQ